MLKKEREYSLVLRAEDWSQDMWVLFPALLCGPCRTLDKSQSNIFKRGFGFWVPSFLGRTPQITLGLIFQKAMYMQIPLTSVGAGGVQHL